MWFFLFGTNETSRNVSRHRNRGMLPPKSRAELACWQQRYNLLTQLEQVVAYCDQLATPLCCAPHAAPSARVRARTLRRMNPPALSQVCARCWIRWHCCCGDTSSRQVWICMQCPVPTFLLFCCPALTLLCPSPPLPVLSNHAPACACACACAHLCLFLCPCPCPCLCLYPCPCPLCAQACTQTVPVLSMCLYCLCSPSVCFFESFQSEVRAHIMHLFCLTFRAHIMHLFCVM